MSPPSNRRSARSGTVPEWLVTRAPRSISAITPASSLCASPPCSPNRLSPQRLSRLRVIPRSSRHTKAPLAQWQSNGLLIRRFWVRIPGGARLRTSSQVSGHLECSTAVSRSHRDPNGSAAGQGLGSSPSLHVVTRGPSSRRSATVASGWSPGGAGSSGPPTSLPAPIGRRLGTFGGRFR